MEQQPNATAIALYRHLERPAYFIKALALMLIGLGIGIALILKVYMLVLTDHVCVADAASLGNEIRCANTLSIVAAGLALAAGFEFASLLFSQGSELALRPVVLGLSSAFLLVLSDLTLATATWELAMMIAALSVSTAGILFLKDYQLKKSSDERRSRQT